jgi:hypothetical protein
MLRNEVDLVELLQHQLPWRNTIWLLAFLEMKGYISRIPVPISNFDVVRNGQLVKTSWNVFNAGYTDEKYVLWVDGAVRKTWKKFGLCISRYKLFTLKDSLLSTQQAGMNIDALVS